MAEVEQEDRHWQSSDMCVSKIVLVEGDSSKSMGSFGTKIQLDIEDHDFKEFQDSYSEVSVFITDKAIENSKLELNIGMAYIELDLNLEKVGLSMFPGEKSRFDVSSKLPTDDNQWITLHFVAIRQKNPEEEIPMSEWDNERKLSTSQQYYDFGVDLVKAKQYDGAFKMFKQSATMATFIKNSQKDDENSVEEETDVVICKSKELKIKCISNLTLCHQYNGDFSAVVQAINYILDSHKNIQNRFKLLSRRGHAHIKLKNFEDAIVDLTEAFQMDSKNSAVISDLNLAKKMKKNHEQKMGNALKKMFV